MAANPSAAAFLAHQLQTFMRWRDPSCLDLAADVLSDIGSGQDASSVIDAASGASRPTAFGLHRIIRPPSCRNFMKDHPEEALSYALWPMWRGTGGAPCRCSCYMETSEHIALLFARWLCGLPVPSDIDIAARYFKLSSNLARQQVDASEPQIDRLYRHLLEERGRQRRARP